MPVDTGSWTGRTLSGGRYQVATKLGEGGMGVVYRAWDNHLESDVVIKSPQASLQGVDDFGRRFLLEVRSLVRLAHPHVVRVLDVDQEEGVCFAVMQFLSGGSLFDRASRRPDGGALPMNPEDLRGWLEPIARALDFIHGEGFIHRDIKPPNILFDRHDNVYLSDFGIAKALAAILPDSHGANLTGAGLAIGTPGYVAPELIMGQQTDGRADQYGLAVTVYEMLVGRNPFSGVPLSAIPVHQTTKGAPPPHERCASIPVPVSMAIHQGMSIEASGRFNSCLEFARAVLQAPPGTLLSPPRGFAATLTQSVVIPALDQSDLPDQTNLDSYSLVEPPPSPPVGTPMRTMVVPGLANATSPLEAIRTPQPTQPSVEAACSNCRRPLRFPIEAIGKQVRCPKCGAATKLTEDLVRPVRGGGTPPSGFVAKVPPPLPSGKRAGTTATGATLPPPLPVFANPKSWYQRGWVLVLAGVVFAALIVSTLAFTNVVDKAAGIFSNRSKPADVAK